MACVCVHEAIATAAASDTCPIRAKFGVLQTVAGVALPCIDSHIWKCAPCSHSQATGLKLSLLHSILLHQVPVLIPDCFKMSKASDLGH